MNSQLNVSRLSTDYLYAEDSNLKIVVDPELSLTSTNPVQNQAIGNMFDKKVDKVDYYSIEKMQFPPLLVEDTKVGRINRTLKIGEDEWLACSDSQGIWYSDGKDDLGNFKWKQAEADESMYGGEWWGIAYDGQDTVVAYDVSKSAQWEDYDPPVSTRKKIGKQPCCIWVSHDRGRSWTCNNFRTIGQSRNVFYAGGVFVIPMYIAHHEWIDEVIEPELEKLAAYVWSTDGDNWHYSEFSDGNYAPTRPCFQTGCQIDDNRFIVFGGDDTKHAHVFTCENGKVQISDETLSAWESEASLLTHMNATKPLVLVRNAQGDFVTFGCNALWASCYYDGTLLVAENTPKGIETCCMFVSKDLGKTWHTMTDQKAEKPNYFNPRYIAHTDYGWVFPGNQEKDIFISKDLRTFTRLNETSFGNTIYCLTYNNDGSINEVHTKAVKVDGKDAAIWGVIAEYSTKQKILVERDPSASAEIKEILIDSITDANVVDIVKKIIRALQYD